MVNEQKKLGLCLAFTPTGSLASLDDGPDIPGSERPASITALKSLVALLMSFKGSSKI